MNNNKQKYSLGLDLGVASIGWGCVLLDDNNNPYKILDTGVVVFKALDNDKGKLYNKDRREKRGQRRVIRRRKERLRRVKSLLIQQGLISKEDTINLFNKKENTQPVNIFELKIKGLHEQLNNEELSRVLIHHAKNRGFKSNRKIDSENEEGKMLSSIKTIDLIMKQRNVYATEAIVIHKDQLYKENSKYNRYHNDDKEYIYGVKREDYEKEVTALLDKQIEYGIVTPEFKEKYLDIWSSQRDFSEGPGGYSKYAVNFESTFGSCKFRTDEKRIASACPSFEIFNLLTKLQNIRYYLIDENGEYIRDEKNKRISEKLTTDEIKKIYAEFDNSKTKTIKYSDVAKVIPNKNIIFKDLPKLSKKEYSTELQEFKTKNSVENITLSPEEKDEFDKVVAKKRLSKVLYSAKSYKEIVAEITKKDPNFIYDIKKLDLFATVLSYARTDDAINNIIDKVECEKDKEEIRKLTEKDYAMMRSLKLKEVGGTGNLSRSLIQDLNIELSNGLTYNEAMEKLGYDHSILERDTTVLDENTIFPTVNQIEEIYSTKINQPNVRHVLSIFRKFYIELVKEYGEPSLIHIELAREIAKKFSDRNEIRNSQIENMTKNANAKIELSKLIYNEDNVDYSKKYFSSDDIIKYKLFKEQGGICMYSGTPILESSLLSDELEVDHILPFSRTFDNTYNNKVLVYKKENQEKKNQTPYEWMKKDKEKWDAFEKRVKYNYEISNTKKEKLLTKDPINREEFTLQSLHATSYLSKLITNIFKDLSKDKDDTNVNTFKGGITSYLRKYYNLNSLTHSYESKDYDRNSTYYYLKDDKNESGLSIKIDPKDTTAITLSAFNDFGLAIETKYVIRFKKKFNPEIETKYYTIFDQDMDNYINNNQDEIIKTFESLAINYSGERRNLFSISDKELSEIDAINNNGLLRELVYSLLNGLKSEIAAKNRSNHFHHQIDALLLATMTNSVEQNITKFHQQLSEIGSNSFDENGELITRESIMKEFKFGNTDIRNLNKVIPVPYDDFIEELKFKIFERDEEELNNKLKTLSNHKNDTKEYKVKYPYFYVDKKVSGPLHEETIMSKDIEDGREVITKKVSVYDINNKNVEKIFDKNGSQKEIYNSLKLWCSLKDSEKKKQVYPKLKNGNFIKKVKINDVDIEKVIQVSDIDESKGYAKIGSVARIEIFKKEDEDKLYFVQISIDRYLKQQKGNYDFNVLLWEGQKKYQKFSKYSDLMNTGYHKVFVMYPGQIIQSIKNEGTEIICKVVGFTDGKLEIESIIGDDLDLMNQHMVNKVSKDSRYFFTISTIKLIKPINFSILGYEK